MNEPTTPEYAEHKHTKECKWTLDLGIPMSGDTDSVKTALALSANIENIMDGYDCSGSGGGFGYRDMQFEGLAWEYGLARMLEIVAYLHEAGFDRIWTNNDTETSDIGGEPYVYLSCITEEESDPQYRQEVMWDLVCPVYFDTGPSHDPSRVQCTKDEEHHEDPRFKDMHVGINPFASSSENVVVWQGGGSCAGDPLPISNVNWDAEWPKDEQAAYFKKVEQILFPNATSNAQEDNNA